MKFSSIQRSLELAKMLTQVGIKEFQSSDLKSRYEQALLITKSLGKLKGAAMKAGQLLSLDLDNYFPKEAIELLGQLQNAATAHPFAEIEKMLNQEISPEKRNLIHSISTVPLGVASIGQVHQARYQNQDIVIKIQYPEVAGSVESDLQILKTLVQTFCHLSGRKMNLDSLFQEFKSILNQELNYKTEAEFLAEYQKNISLLAPRDGYKFRTPQVFPEISSNKVLAMTFEKGITLRQWMNLKPNLSHRLLMAQAILDLYFHEFFEWGLVQTDPNLGNFLIDQNESGLLICLIDFGATRRYSRDFVQKYIHLLELVANNQSSDLKKFLIEFQMLDARESESVFLVFEKMLKIAVKPFFSENSNADVFNFGDTNYLLESRAATIALSKELVFTPPPHSILFLHRKLAGVYSILKNLDVQMSISHYWQMMKDLSRKPL
jgi:aarF domain-containing kinase